ncbi:MAG TPA: zinc-dependent dehydrogenase [Actinomycetota bacterium]|nr:zinc-dependent dehydrogenase [Actinomycetota bacterium]
MRVVRFYAPRDVRVEDAPEPSAGPGDLVIRVRNCSLCGTDAKIWRSGHPNLSPPRVLGHEVAGEVGEVGEGAAGWSVGDRVQVIAAIPDGACDECRHGWMTVCPNQELIGYQYDGGFAERMRIPAKVLAVNGVNRIPEGLSFAEASVAEPLACVINGQEHARVGEGDTVVVVGAGPIGCMHVRLARARGAERVFLIELSQQRLEMAAGLVAPDEAIGAGAADTVETVRKLTDGRGADVIIVAAASGKAQEDALQMAARRGRVSFFGGLPKDKPTITCDANIVHYREVDIVGANGSSPDHNRQALALIASGAVPVADLITHRLPLERTVEGIHTVARGEAIKVTIEA